MRLVGRSYIVEKPQRTRKVLASGGAPVDPLTTRSTNAQCSESRDIVREETLAFQWHVDRKRLTAIRLELKTIPVMQTEPKLWAECYRTGHRNEQAGKPILVAQYSYHCIAQLYIMAKIPCFINRFDYLGFIKNGWGESVVDVHEKRG